MAIKMDQAEAAGADAILRQLDEFNVSINRDWGYLSYLLPYLRIRPSYTSKTEETAPRTVVWSDGILWNLSELDSVKSAVLYITSRLGGIDSFKRAMGRTRIVKSSRTGRLGPILFSGGRCISPGRITLYGDFLKLPSQVQQSIVIHEFGHIWDWTSLGRLSWELNRVVRSHARSTGQPSERPPGTTDPDGKRYAEKWLFEDWAVSFHAFIQPEYRAFQPPHHGLGPVRQAFVQQQIRQL